MIFDIEYWSCINMPQKSYDIKLIYDLAAIKVLLEHNKFVNKTKNVAFGFYY